MSVSWQRNPQIRSLILCWLVNCRAAAGWVLLQLDRVRTVVSYLLFKQGQCLLFCYIFGKEKREKRTFPLHSVSQSQYIQYTGVCNVLASSMALVVLQCLLSHQIPEQHAEHCVRSQTEEDWTHAFIQPQHAFGLAHLQHTIWKSMVQAPLKERQMVFAIVCTQFQFVHDIFLLSLYASGYLL